MNTHALQNQSKQGQISEEIPRTQKTTAENNWEGSS